LRMQFHAAGQLLDGISAEENGHDFSIMQQEMSGAHSCARQAEMETLLKIPAKWSYMKRKELFSKDQTTSASC